ncbi:hypothetical protein AB5J62_15115 [Amycolatopsis sp. cg5]|uniref:hypothetical protein n=1 Tax=Amycolatopsis sp. cg5 TaxID=3238802 RepID=UPI003525DDDA
MSKKPTDRPRRKVEDYLIPEEDRDIWLRNLLACLGEALGILNLGINKSERKSNPYELSVRDSESPIDIELQKTKTGMQLSFSGWATDAELDAWLVAARKAESATNASRQELRWSAIVGPNIEITRSRSAPKLAEECMLGTIKLTPSQERLFEVVPTGSHLTNQRGFILSWPARASGAVLGHDYQQAEAAAGRELRLLCALLSITFDECWDVRRGLSSSRRTRSTSRRPRRNSWRTASQRTTSRRARSSSCRSGSAPPTSRCKRTRNFETPSSRSTKHSA